MRHSAGIDFKPITFTGGEYTLIQDDVNKTLVVDEATDVIINTPNLTMEEGDFIGIKQANTGKFTLVEDGNTLVSIGSLTSGGQGAYVSLVKNLYRIDVVGSTEVSGGGAFIPLAGTDVGSPVMGDVEIDGTVIYTTDGSGFFGRINFENGNGLWLQASDDLAGEKSIFLNPTAGNEGVIVSDDISNIGLVGLQDFTPNIPVDYTGDLIYPQVKWVRQQVGWRGTATLSAGTVTVNTDKIKPGYKIYVTVDTPAGTQGFISAPQASIVDETSFVINSSSNTETSTVYWWIAP